MADITASVLAKLKNKVKASGISYQQCLQLFFQEEFFRCTLDVKILTPYIFDRFLNVMSAVHLVPRSLLYFSINGRSQKYADAPP